MFNLIEDAGKKFAKGAKKEILEPRKNSIDWEKVIKAGAALLELGIFALAVFGGGKSCGGNKELGCNTIVINNVIQR